MAKPVTPEPKFFLVDDLYEKGLEHYARTWFSDAGAAPLAGEKSTDYLESAAAAERIARDLPRREARVHPARAGRSRAFELSVDEDERPRNRRLRHGAAPRGPARARVARAAAVRAAVFVLSPAGCTPTCSSPTSIGSPAIRSWSCASKTSSRRRGGSLRRSTVSSASSRGRTMSTASASSTRRIGRSGSELAESVQRELTASYAGPNRRLARLLGPQFEMWP